MDKMFHINLVTDDNEKKDNKTDGKVNDSGSESNEYNEVMFKVKIDKAEPAGVRISKRNCAIITIVSGGEEESKMI
jgi:hypothetical protein